MQNLQAAMIDQKSKPSPALWAGMVGLMLVVGCGSPDGSQVDTSAPNLPRSAPPLTPAATIEVPGPTAPEALAPAFSGRGDTEALAADVVKLHGRIEARLDLSFSPVTDNDLGKMEFPDTITAINLSGTRITDRGVEHLMRARNLQELVLVDTPVTENVIETLKRMPHLTVVQLDNTGVPTARQLELVRFFSPRARARTQRQVQAAEQK